MSTPTAVILKRSAGYMTVCSTGERNAVIRRAVREFQKMFSPVAEVAVREVMEEYHMLAEDSHLASYEGGLSPEEEIRLEFMSCFMDELVVATS